MPQDSQLVVAGIRSYDLTALTLSHSEAKGMTQLLATYLAHRYNSRRGYAHPSQATIASHLKRSERAIRMLVAELNTTNEWYIVTGRGGPSSTGSAWSSSRYYPTYDWVQKVVNGLHEDGNNDALMNRLLNHSRVVEVLPGGVSQQTDVQITVPGSDITFDTNVEDDTFLESLQSVMTDTERESYKNSRPSDRQQSRSEAQSLIHSGYSLTLTIRKAKERARVRPERFEGGYARWLWNFAYTMPIRAADNSSVWENDESAWG